MLSVLGVEDEVARRKCGGEPSELAFRPLLKGRNGPVALTFFPSEQPDVVGIRLDVDRRERHGLPGGWLTTSCGVRLGEDAGSDWQLAKLLQRRCELALDRMRAVEDGERSEKVVPLE